MCGVKVRRPSIGHARWKCLSRNNKWNRSNFESTLCADTSCTSSWPTYKTSSKIVHGCSTAISEDVYNQYDGQFRKAAPQFLRVVWVATRKNGEGYNRFPRVEISAEIWSQAIWTDRTSSWRLLNNRQLQRVIWKLHSVWRGRGRYPQIASWTLSGIHCSFRNEWG